MRRARAIGGVAGVLLLVTVATLVLSPDPDREFRDHVDAMRAAGEPTTVGELSLPNARDSENAATEIEAALRWVEEYLGAAEASLEPFKPSLSHESSLSSQQREACESFASRLGPFADRVATALDRPRCTFSPPNARAAADLMPSQERLDRTETLLLRIVRHAREPADQIEACRTLARLAGRIEGVDQTERVHAVEFMRICTEYVRSRVEAGTWDPALVRERMDDDLAARWLPRAGRTLRDWRAYLVEEHSSHLDDIARRGWVASVHARLDRMFRRNERCRCEARDSSEVLADAEFLRRVASIPTSSYPRFVEQWAEVDRTTQNTRSGWIPPHFHESVLTDARTSLARVALAAAAFRDVHGDLPATLADLRDAFPDGVPLDPYTEAPLAYETTDAGVRIASAGRLGSFPPLDAASLRERGLLWDLPR